MHVLLLHPQQLQLMHSEVELPGAVVAAVLAPQLIDHTGLPGALHGPSAAAVQPLAEFFGHSGCVTHHLDTVEVVLRLGTTTDDPGSLSQAQTTPDHQCVGGFGAVVVLVVELVGLEGVVGVEAIGARQKLWTWSHLTAAPEERSSHKHHTNASLSCTCLSSMAYEASVLCFSPLTTNCTLCKTKVHR